MKRADNLWELLTSDENLAGSVEDVNDSHHWRTHHRPNTCTAWVEETKEERVKELQEILEEGFRQKKATTRRRYDASARKWRVTNEPAQWPDQYIHHALVRVLMPVMMRGMDPYCCGSIRGRGTLMGKKAIERWMRKDPKGTRYCMSLDIHHFYDSLQPAVVLDRMRKLVKDRRVLDLIERVTKDGILIGAYPSQWFANTTLQPLDHLIREGGYGVAHYMRYMDNFTIFGPNKRKLRKLRAVIEKWLNQRGMRIKKDWQIFPTKCRMPNAVGYRYGREYTIPRKYNLLRLKRAIARYRWRRDRHRRIFAGMAASIVSRFGQLRHCNNRNLYLILLRGERLLRQLKAIIRENRRKEDITWSMYLEQRAKWRSLKQREVPIPT